jgi:hypothetical protein
MTGALRRNRQGDSVQHGEAPRRGSGGLRQKCPSRVGQDGKLAQFCRTAPCLADPGLRASQMAAGPRPQIELADAALHTEQQAIVRPARVVYAIKVDEAGFYQSAQEPGRARARPRG